MAFLADNLNAALKDARETTEVFGPTLVYSRDAMQWQADHAASNAPINEWIDEQIGSAIKWPLPILSSTRAEWLSKVHSDLFVVQTPSHLPAEQLSVLSDLIRKGQPVAILGSEAGGIDETLANLAGLSGDFSSTVGKVNLCEARNHAPELVKGAEESFKTFCYPQQGVSATGARVIYEAQGSPQLTIATADGKQVAIWNPPDLPSSEGKPLSGLWGNAGTPYALAAGVMNELLKRNACTHAEAIDLGQTMNFAAWRIANGQVRILAGNLEEGLRDDADLQRHTTLGIPESWRVTGWKDQWSGRFFAVQNRRFDIELRQGSSVLLLPTAP